MYFLKKIVLAHFQSLFGRINRDALWKNEGKLHEGRCMSVFFVNFQVAVSQLHYRITSSEISIKWTPSNGYFSFLYKMLQKHLWNSFLLYLVVKILQLLYEISSCPARCSIKQVFWKASQNSQINGRSIHPEVFRHKKDVFKDFAKFTEKHLYWSLFFNKVAGWKYETVRSSH